MSNGITRRTALVACAALARAAERPSTTAPSEQRRYRDSATEFELTRLTDPEKGRAWLPRPPLRAVYRGDGALLYCSDRTGTPQAWRMDLGNGESRQLTNASSLLPSTLTLLGGDRSILYFDDTTLVLASPRPRTLYTCDADWRPTGVFAVSEDGSYAAFCEERTGRFRLRLGPIGRGSMSTLLESSEPVSFLRFRPRKNALVYGHGGSIGIVGYDGRGDRKPAIPECRVLDAQWSADGRFLHYLSAPLEPVRATQLRDYNPDTAEDKLVAPTTQFVGFTRNADSSVFVGVSGSKASPYILLLLRVAKRELTIAEHKASDPARIAVVLSGNSQRLFYESDRQGRGAIYTIALERFLEKTDTTANISLSPLLQPS